MYDLTLEMAEIPPQADTDIRDTTVASVIRDMAAMRPGDPALIEVEIHGGLGRRWTHAELLADSERLGLALSTRFAPGERITVWAPNIPEWVLIEYACAFAGLVLVTANPSFQAEELRYVLEQSGSSGLFLVRSFRGNPMADIAKKAVEGLQVIREVTDLEDSDALYATGDRPAKLVEVTPGDAAQIQYTSGTTGFPKGAVLSHGGLTNNARLYADRTGSRPDSIWMNTMPMFHTSGCGMATLGPIQAGCPVYLFKAFDPFVILKRIESEKITLLGGVPTMLVALLEAQRHEKRDTSSLELAVSGGSMVAPDLVRAVTEAFGCKFQIVYGQTETSPLISQHQLDDSFDDVCNTAGQPMPQTAVSIRSVDDNSVLPVDHVGEICVRGYLNMLGYHANPQATAETVDSEGWLHTGDLGAIDARGYVRITGRVKEMIIRGGENMFPAEIENVLLTHADVAEVAIVGLPDAKWGEIVACFVRTEGNREIEPNVLHAHCREHLSAQKTPAVWCRVESFPLTGSGKIRKFALRDMYLAGEIGEM